MANVKEESKEKHNEKMSKEIRKSKAQKIMRCQYG